MAIETEVLVIGGGLAGATAALAASDAGARVRLVSANQSTLRQASGLIDVLGYPPQPPVEPRGADDPRRGGEAPGGESRADGGRPPDHGARSDGGTAADDAGPIVDPFDAIPELPEGHPYERVGVDAVRDGLALFDRVADGYAGGHTDANALVPTHGGTVKPTARYPEHVAHGLASDERDALLVGFDSVTGFDAPLAAEHLRAADVPFRVDGVTVRFPGELRADASVNRYADLFDADEVPGRESESISGRAAVAEHVQIGIDGASIEPERIGVPAILGEEAPDEVRAELEERLGLPVFEVPTGAPSLPGRRLEQQLFDALAERDVRTAVGRPVVGYDAADDRIETLDVQHSESGTIPHGAQQIVLATGGLVGRGIDTDRETVEEPVFGCHVPHPTDRYDWFADDAFGAHPFAQFGVAVDRELRPLTAEDEPEFANLRAAGSVLGGYDFAAEKSGAGVSIATGYAAGTAAAEEVA